MSDKYGVDQDIYCYPNSNVLINKLGLFTQSELNEAELEFTQYRIEQYVPDFEAFSLATLQDIHFFLFQDIYSWAGEIRKVDISKGNSRFANVRFIETESGKLFRQLQQQNYLIDFPNEEFITRLAHYYSELNVIHPFRDGNGRAQRILFEALSINAGYEVHWQVIERSEWLAANIAAFNCRLAPLTSLLQRAVTKISGYNGQTV
ncbi:MAG: putative adenosine monophosphate-protein transferase Fic [Pseudomonadota bacterium]